MTRRRFSFLWHPAVLERPRHQFKVIVDAVHWDRDHREVAIDDGYQARFVGVSRVVSLSLDEFRFVTEHGEVVIIRALRPGD